MNNILVAARQIESCGQEMSSEEYNRVCVIQLCAFGGPTIVLHVNHLCKLPPYLENLLHNP